MLWPTSGNLPIDVPEPTIATRIWRFWNVVWLAARVYVGYKGTQLWTRLISDRNKPELYRRQDLRAAQALNRTALRLEGLLIKACQFIATRADVLPDEWVSTLSGLHDRVPPRPFAMIRDQIERELRRPLESVYAEFDPKPLASASLAQVHRARLHDGRICAVKVQYPGIDGIIRADLRNMIMVLKWLAMLERDFDYRILMREALKYVPMELDFQHEAGNAETMRRNFAADANLIIPEVYREFTTRRVLTMELVEGIKVTDVEALERAGIDKHVVAQKLIENFCDQILRDGFFHADPHPGNILIQPGPKIVLLDFGLAKDFPATFRDGLVRLTFCDPDFRSRRHHQCLQGARLPHPQRLIRHAARAIRSFSRQHHQIEEGLCRQRTGRAVLRRISARDPRQPGRRSARRRFAGEPHDGPAQRPRQNPRLASGPLHNHHAVRTAPDGDGASRNHSCPRLAAGRC